MTDETATNKPSQWSRPEGGFNEYDAVNLLYKCRHNLSPDLLRSLASIWECASAARYGAPYERFWEIDPDHYATHDVKKCEHDDRPSDLVDPVWV